MNENWRNKVKEYLSKFDSIFVACSGGADSTALLHALYKMKQTPIALHCNFQLRGSESDEDEKWIINQCEKWNISIQTKTWNTEAEIKKRGGNVQEVARNLRYEWFSAILKNNPNAVVCTAHHQDDNLEQLLMSAIGSGKLNDLAGIPQKRAGFYRPLLTVSKIEIQNYLKENHLTWREDSSNAKNNYTRNKIRNQLIPLIKTIDKRAQKALTNLQHDVKELYAEIDVEIELFLTQQVNGNHFLMPFCIWDKKISIWKLRFIQKLSGNVVQKLELDKLRKAKNAAYSTIGKIKITKEKEGFFVTKVMQENGFYASINIGEDLETPLGKIVSTHTDEDIIKNTSIVYIDPAKIKGDLHIRMVEKGDKMLPFGKKNEKKVSELLINAKISNHLKNKQLIVCDEEKIIWLVGIRFSEKAKLEKTTDKKIKLQIFHNFFGEE